MTRDRAETFKIHKFSFHSYAMTKTKSHQCGRVVQPIHKDALAQWKTTGDVGYLCSGHAKEKYKVYS